MKDKQTPKTFEEFEEKLIHIYPELKELEMTRYAKSYAREAWSAAIKSRDAEINELKEENHRTIRRAVGIIKKLHGKYMFALKTIRLKDESYEVEVANETHALEEKIGLYAAEINKLKERDAELVCVLRDTLNICRANASTPSIEWLKLKHRIEALLNGDKDAR